MNMWKSAALAAALAVAAGAGAALTPAAHGQTAARAPRAVEVVSGWGGSQIGVSINDVDPSDSKVGQAGGVVIEDVTEDSPAARAGLQKGDVVVEFDGERVRSARQFARLVQETVPGRKVPAVAMRDGQRTTLTVEPRENSARLFGDLDHLRGSLEDFAIARVPPPPARPMPAPRPPSPDIEALIWTRGNTLGITIGDLSPQLAEYFGTKEGVLVTAVVDDSAVAKAGLKAGDVVTSVNGTAVGRPSELRRGLERLRAGDEFTIGVVRDKKSLTVKGTVEERRDRRRTFRS